MIVQCVDRRIYTNPVWVGENYVVSIPKDSPITLFYVRKPRDTAKSVLSKLRAALKSWKFKLKTETLFNDLMLLNDVSVPCWGCEFELLDMPPATELYEAVGSLVNGSWDYVFEWEFETQRVWELVHNRRQYTSLQDFFGVGSFTPNWHEKVCFMLKKSIGRVEKKQELFLKKHGPAITLKGI